MHITANTLHERKGDLFLVVVVTIGVLVNQVTQRKLTIISTKTSSAFWSAQNLNVYLKSEMAIVESFVYSAPNDVMLVYQKITMCHKDTDLLHATSLF